MSLAEKVERPSVSGPAALGGACRLLAGPERSSAERLAEHLDRLGRLPALGPKLIDEVMAAGLRGRGGGGFPTGEKLAAVGGRRGVRRPPLVVANGVESEPASAKDQTLLCRRPHLVLDGLQLAGRAVGAGRLILALRQRGPAAAVVREALRERQDQIRGELEVELRISPGGFVSGEETALLGWVGGGPVKPRPTPPRPAERGLDGRPTLVQNVETLAHLALIVRFGATWFRSMGTAKEPGTCLVTVSGAVERAGVGEIAIGTPLLQILEGAGWERSSAAVLIGGYFGTWLPARVAVGARFDRAELAHLGAAPGSGVIQVLAPELCGLREGARIARWLANETSGQCGPCVRGLPAVAGALETLAQPAPAPPGLAARVLKWCDDVQGRGACHHPDGAVRHARSVLTTFASERAEHSQGRCTGTRSRTRGGQALELPG